MELSLSLEREKQEASEPLFLYGKIKMVLIGKASIKRTGLSKAILSFKLHNCNCLRDNLATFRLIIGVNFLANVLNKILYLKQTKRRFFYRLRLAIILVH